MERAALKARAAAQPHTCIGLSYHDGQGGEVRWLFRGTLQERALLVYEADCYSRWVREQLSMGLVPPPSLDVHPTCLNDRFLARHAFYHDVFKRPEARGDYEAIGGNFSVCCASASARTAGDSDDDGVDDDASGCLDWGTAVEWDASLRRPADEPRNTPCPGACGANVVAAGRHAEMQPPRDLVPLLTAPPADSESGGLGIGFTVLPATRLLVERASAAAAQAAAPAAAAVPAPAAAPIAAPAARGKPLKRARLVQGG